MNEDSKPELLVLKSNNRRYSRQHEHKTILTILIVLAAIGGMVGIIVTLVVIPIYRPSIGCLTRCVVDLRVSISRGDRTLFPKIQNPARDQAIKAFKQGKYSEAAEFFKRSIAANRSNPELLIYYNNARANQQDDPPFTLATVVSVDNAESTAQEILRGVAQAQNQFNEKEGLDGRLLEIAIANDGNKPDKAQKVAQELVKDSSILGVIGSDSSDATKAVLGEYEKAGLAIISPTSTSTDKSLNSKVFFRTAPSNDLAGKKLAEYAKNSLGINRVVIFHNPNSAYRDGMKEQFTKAFRDRGGTIVANIPLTPDLNIDREIAKSIESHAQAIALFPGLESQDTSIAFKIARANASVQNTKNPKLKLIGGDALYSNTTLKNGGKAVEGLILVVPWFRDAPQSKNFAQAAVKQWGGGISWRTATSYDATQAFIKALSANSSQEEVLQELRQINLSPSETSGATLQFLDNGERQGQPTLVKVEKGQFVYLK